MRPYPDGGAARRKEDPKALAPVPGRLGTVYRGGQGQWAWALHRITGVGVLLFLFAHILDTALVGFGPEVFNRVVAVYHNPLIRLLEMGLAAMVLFHALNGLRIVAIDFFPRLADRHQQLLAAVVSVWVLLMIPTTYFMGRLLVRSLR